MEHFFSFIKLYLMVLDPRVHHHVSKEDCHLGRIPIFRHTQKWVLNCQDKLANMISRGCPIHDINIYIYVLYICILCIESTLHLYNCIYTYIQYLCVAKPRHIVTQHSPVWFTRPEFGKGTVQTPHPK